MMDTDEALSAALELGCALALVRVMSVAHEKAGTRSATAAYAAVVESSIEGALPTPVVLKHFGTPGLAVGQLCAVAAWDSGRYHGAWQLQFAAPVDADDVAAAEATLRARVQRLRA